MTLPTFPILLAVITQQGKKALAAGSRIRAGDCSRQSLKEIFEWKTNNRGISRIERNDDADIARALQEARDATDEGSAIERLLSLFGVGVPVASAVMTAIYPDRYTVIDFRALASLGNYTKTRSVSLYLRYLRYCREAAAKYGVSLRNFDRALWQRDRELSEHSCR